MENEERTPERQRRRENAAQPAAEVQEPGTQQPEAPQADAEPAVRGETQEELGRQIAEGKSALQALSDALADAPEVPLAHVHLVSRRRYEDLSGQLRMVMPRLVQEADRLLARRTEILDEASAQAKRLREDADRYAREHREAADGYERDTRTAAEEYRRQVMDEANRQGQAMLQEADQKAREIVEAANQRAQQMAETSEIARRAEVYANEVREAAQQQAGAMLQQASRQTDLMLSGASAALSRSASQMAQLRDSLLSQEPPKDQQQA